VSADQLRRAADLVESDGPTYTDERAVAALLRAAAIRQALGLHDWHRTTCRHHDKACRHSTHQVCTTDTACVGCLLDDIAAAYLEEEPQP
jgi:hypothetical protein